MAERMTDAEYAASQATEVGEWECLQSMETATNGQRGKWCATHMKNEAERTAREIDRLVAEQIAPRTNTTEGAT